MAILGAMIVVLGTLISFAVTCVYFLIGNKKWKKALICIPICLFGGTFIFALSPEDTSSTTDENSVVSVVDEEEMVQEENTPIAENIKIEVEAESYDEAITKAKNMYYDCELILDASDLVEQEFK